MSRENADVVRRLVEAFNAQDADAAYAILKDDAGWRPAYTGGGTVEGAVYRGHPGFRRYLEDLSETWGENEDYVDELRHVGERVPTLWLTTASATLRRHSP